MASQNPNPAVGGFKGCETKLNPETFEHYEFFFCENREGSKRLAGNSSMLCCGEATEESMLNELTYLNCLFWNPLALQFRNNEHTDPIYPVCSLFNWMVQPISAT